MADDARKLVMGSLLVGAGVLSGNGLLLTVAGGIGVNWSSEALDGLWQQYRAHMTAESPLARAYARAFRRALRELRTAYSGSGASQHPLAAFDLLQDSARELAQTGYAAAIGSLLDAQQALEQALSELLLGHDEQQVAYLRAHLLEATALAFQRELMDDHEALTQFQGWILAALAANVGALRQSLAGVPEVMAKLQDLPAVQAVLDQQREEIAAQIQTLAAAVQRLSEQQDQPRTIVFDNDGLRTASLEQVGGSKLLAPDLGIAPAVLPPPALPAGNGPLTVFQNTNVQAQTTTQVAGNSYQQVAAERPPAAPPAVVLALFAGASDNQALELRREAQILRDILAEVRTRFRLELMPASTVDDLSRGLLEYRPVLLHFSGHGSPDGLLFEDTTGNGSQLVPRTALVHELSAFAPPLQCAILNACYSEALTQTPLVLGVPYVIGMRSTIADPSAIEFTRGFYEALAAGADIPFAYDRGCSRIGLKQLPGSEIPVLWQNPTKST